MNRRILSCAVVAAFLLAGAGCLDAQRVINTGPEAGRALSEQLRSLRPEENVKWRGTLQIYGRENPTAPVPISCETTLGDTNWSVTYQTGATATQPAEKLTVIFSATGPNRYLYAKAAKPGEAAGSQKELTGAAAEIPLAGSDFWLADLGFEFYHWPEQNRLKGDRTRGRACHVLESVNPRPQPGGYGRVLTWVDEQSNQPLQAKAFAADKKTVLKDFELGSVAKVKGHYQLKNLKMYNLKTGSRTLLNFDLGE